MRNLGRVRLVHISLCQQQQPNLVWKIHRLKSAKLPPETNSEPDMLFNVFDLTPVQPSSWPKLPKSGFAHLWVRYSPSITKHASWAFTKGPGVIEGNL